MLGEIVLIRALNNQLMNIEKTCHRAKENGAEGSKGTEDFPQSSRPEHYLQKDQSHDMS